MMSTNLSTSNTGATGQSCSSIMNLPNQMSYLSGITSVNSMLQPQSVMTSVTTSSSIAPVASSSSSNINPQLSMISGQVPGTQTNNNSSARIMQLIQDLLSMETREQALMELSRKRENVEDLAILLWNSFGAIAALLQEIVSVYPTINPPTLNAHLSNRVCNALALLQCVASHTQTRAVFLQANIPLFLYPFLNMTTSSKTRPFEYLRLTSLGVIGALVKTDEKEVINFLLKTEIIPLCLRIMESGTELSKTVATFILQKILLDDTGLNYICQTYDRFSHVAMILGKMVMALSKDQSARLLKHVIRCYLRLSDNARAREALRHCLPDLLRNNTFNACLANDRPTKNWLIQLLKNIEKDSSQQTNSSTTTQVANSVPGSASSSLPSVPVRPSSSPGATANMMINPGGQVSQAGAGQMTTPSLKPSNKM
ncbi:hypothetical protein SSS_05372 [Sarcoptes scabiei]|uniref:CCR4-NOT transcription complex subunit 9 n=1 Tax=Sarcoptes scabiei TaxID=52283 RepID=A0A834R7P6_SARSC|nr:hypothetical protein SSS_05372 [Sarcoptes scabiei]UXI18576.1 Ras-related protein Rab-8A [Sarcoptes scabiei]